MGQFVQDGTRLMFETVLNIDIEDGVTIPYDAENADGLNFLAGKSLNFVNQKAHLGTVLAHTDGDVPNLAINLTSKSAFDFGYLVYFFVDGIIGIRRCFWGTRFASGIRTFMAGMAKKVLLANTFALAADKIWALGEGKITGWAAWLGMICYTLQIYYDFSGYSDMAIGLGHIFGFDFLENFKYPYLSRSIREFWQRWHISLGNWFREYVYIPLGGNRKGEVRTYINLLIVFFLTGMWHGASWNFIAWGLFHGAFQIVERLGFGKFLKKNTVIGHVYCVFVVVVGWVLFRAEGLRNGIAYLARMFMPWRYGFDKMFTVLNVWNLRTGLILLIGILGCGIIQRVGERLPKLTSKWKNGYVEMGYLTVVFVYCIILLAAGTYNPFIYFRF
jgi:alginate O-acetyltransferase complex protein AlgI